MLEVLRRYIAVPVAILACAAASARAAAGEEARPLFFWSVQSEGGTVYLLGSVHVGTEDMYPLDDGIEDAFAASSALVVEVDLDERAQARLEELILEKATYKDGTMLRDHISPETFSFLRQYLDERELPQFTFYTMKPWFVALTLEILELRRLGFDQTLGIDRHFLERARETGKPIQEIESIGSQIDLLAGFPEELQELFLIYTLRDNQQSRSKLDEVMAAWRNGDPEALEKLMRKEIEEDPRLSPIYERLFDERNRNMAARIRELLDTGGTYFVVVGAAHMAGEQGIVRLIEREGNGVYSVRQHRERSSPLAPVSARENAASTP